MHQHNTGSDRTVPHCQGPPLRKRDTKVRHSVRWVSPCCYLQPKPPFANRQWVKVERAEVASRVSPRRLSPLGDQVYNTTNGWLRHLMNKLQQRERHHAKSKSLATLAFPSGAKLSSLCSLVSCRPPRPTWVFNRRGNCRKLTLRFLHSPYRIESVNLDG